MSMSHKKYVIGVDVGGTKCAVSLIGLNCAPDDGTGTVGKEHIVFLEKVRMATSDFPDPYSAIAVFEREIRSLLQKHGIDKSEVHGIGISCGGPLSSKQGLILSPPNLPGWDRVPIVSILSEAFGLPVKLQNDANACALAEWKFGAGAGFSNVVFLTFGTGMGAGLILNGALYSGTSDMAGEVGHLRLAPDGPFGFGKRGSFEGFCSGGGIAKLGKQVVLGKLLAGEKVDFCPAIEQLDGLTAEKIGKAAQAGDPVAAGIMRTSGEYLGVGLSLLIDILNPEVIVIGSIFGRQHDLLWPAAEAVIREEALSYSTEVCRVVPAGLGEQVGDYASLAVALYAEPC